MGTLAQQKLEFAIGGMHCAACSARIERVVSTLPGVTSISVSLASNTATLVPEAKTDTATLSATIIQSVANLGFSAEPLVAIKGHDALSQTAARFEKRRENDLRELAARKRELLPAFFFALPLLLLSMGEMLGMPLPAAIHPQTAPLVFALIQLALCVPVLWTGRRFFLLGLPALWRKSPTMDTLVAIGTGTAFLFSLWNTLHLALYGPAPAHAIPLGHAADTSGFFSMLFGTGHAANGIDLYFESAAVVIALVSLGKYLEVRSRMQTGEAMSGLLKLAPETALRVLPSQGGSLEPSQSTQYADHAALSFDSPREEILLAAVEIGDILLVRPGGRIPVDGTVLGGASFVDESMLTGESMPVEKNIGSSLAGGSMNQQGALFMRAERVGADTMLARIVRLVQEAQGSKAPIANLADTVSLYFVPAVIGIAIFSGLCWWIFGDSVAFAVRIFVSVMVIACPCAMGLATPMSIMVGTGRGAQLGVLFKNGNALERASHITSIVFDKTGTLTQGRPALVDIALLSQTPHLADDSAIPQVLPALPQFSILNSLCLPQNTCTDVLLRLAASLEAASEHPLARAIVEKAQEQSLPLWPVENFLATPGKGVTGDIVTEKGRIRAAVGNAAFAEALLKEKTEPEDKNLPAHSLHTNTLPALLNQYATEGKTPVVLLVEQIPAAVLAVADSLREEAKSVIATLKAMNITCAMLTGDNALTAKAIAAETGITQVTAQVLPEGKDAVIRAMQEKGQVVGMVGDGVNDAPALARADVGFAMSSGIDVAIETGDIILMRHGLHGLPLALALGRATMRNIRENLFWAFAYNIVGIPFAAGAVYLMGGPVLSPMLAGAAMALSSVSVVANALRLRFFHGK